MEPGGISRERARLERNYSLGQYAYIPIPQQESRASINVGYPGDFYSDAMDNARDYYLDLGIQLGATTTEIQAAYDNFIASYHSLIPPNYATRRFRKVREAYEKLIDPIYRAIYNVNYRQHFMQLLEGETDSDEEETMTRTEIYEAEQARRRNRQGEREERRRSSAARGGQQHAENSSSDSERIFVTELGNRPTAQAPGDRAARIDEGMAHGLEVRVSGHPATTQDCRWEASNWVRPSAASDVCAFCLRFGDNRFRCTGCQIVACQPCFGQIALLARGPNDYPLDDGPEYYRVYT